MPTLNLQFRLKYFVVNLYLFVNRTQVSMTSRQPRACLEDYDVIRVFKFICPHQKISTALHWVHGVLLYPYLFLYLLVNAFARLFTVHLWAPEPLVRPWLCMYAVVQHDSAKLLHMLRIREPLGVC